jgi:NaMN:DMB phosphoribosyltransferase
MVALAKAHHYTWLPQRVVVGTTRWVAEDPTGNTASLAATVDASLIATQLSFQQSRFAVLQAYEAGFVKEGVGAGACAIAASLYQGWHQPQLLNAIEELLEQSLQICC